jgi:hypothetical protein
VFSDALPQAELLLANITRQGVELLAPRLSGEELIASGYLAAERPSPAGWRHCERREADGWAADLFSPA